MLLSQLLIKKIHCRVNSQGCGITRDNHGEPLATSYHSNFMGTVDYIWYVYYMTPNIWIPLHKYWFTDFG